MKTRHGLWLILCASIGLAGVGFFVPSVLGVPGSGGQVQVPTSDADFFLPGTQPNKDSIAFEPILASNNCSYCHGEYNMDVAPFDSWVVSMMGQSARDPVWHAALAIANQDANLAGELCIRCHAPGAWLGGRSATGDLSQFGAEDFDGINCHFCHRVVNPTAGSLSAVGYPNNIDPTPDPEILGALSAEGLLPDAALGNASFVVDPHDVRRGPFDDVPMNFHGGPELIFSPYHSDGAMCGTCHDVSNPVYSPLPSGQLVLNQLGQPHPTMDKGDMFPEQRTYSEWLNSTFATTGVSFPDNRFGGNHPTGVMKSCQDCHMPDQQGGGCVFYDGDPKTERPNVPQHSFAGANTWVLRGVQTQMGDDAGYFGLTQERVDASIARNIQMLRDASDMVLNQVGGQLAVKIINQSGHKLPTGYPEGRRAWLNVKFFDATGVMLAERGAYNMQTATLNAGDTKVYLARHVIDEAIAAATHLPVGQMMHLALSNKVEFDNRIPPRGFTNAAFVEVGAAPIGYAYPDGQYWDTTNYAIPAGAKSAVATFYYQTSSREYMEFVRDTALNGSGVTAYNLWVQHGRSAPVDMDSVSITFAASNPADFNGDGVVNGTDLTILLSNWGGTGQGDASGDGIINGTDLSVLLASWTG
ncbi:MAG: hypothetical protein EXS15_07705 [Phycisphaerales bacterium]|nr:hypothetical protein [Phycisphaerales bacterium]